GRRRGTDARRSARRAARRTARRERACGCRSTPTGSARRRRGPALRSLRRPRAGSSSAPSRECPFGFERVGEGQSPPGDLLVGLVPLAREKHDVGRTRLPHPPAPPPPPPPAPPPH